MDTASIPEELKPYLSLYLEVLFESPVLRENGMRNYSLSLSTIWLLHSLACCLQPLFLSSYSSEQNKSKECRAIQKITAIPEGLNRKRVLV